MSGIPTSLSRAKCAPLLTSASLREWRERHRLTQQHLAEYLHVTRDTVIRWEGRAETLPATLALALLALEVLLAPAGKAARKAGAR